LLEEIKNRLDYSGPVKDVKNKPQCLLTISSRQIVKDIIKLGGAPAKTFTIKFPDMPDEYVADFIRGFFDGDGSVYYIKQLKSYMSKITCASKDFITSMKSILESEGINSNIEVFFSALSTAECYNLKFSQNATRRLRDYLYRDGNCLKLDRKYNLFKLAGKINLSTKGRVFSYTMREASEQLVKWGIRTNDEWNMYKRQNKLPEGFPRAVGKVYRKNWRGWRHFIELGLYW